MTSEPCEHGAAGRLVCPSCLDLDPALHAGHLVFTDDHGGIMWLPVERVTLMRASSDDSDVPFVDISVCDGDEALEAVAGQTSTWFRIRCGEPAVLALRIAEAQYLTVERRRPVGFRTEGDGT